MPHSIIDHIRTCLNLGEKYSAEGYVIKPKTLATLSPYLTGHLKRYGDYIVDFDNLPQPLETAMLIPIEPETQ